MLELYRNLSKTYEAARKNASAVAKAVIQLNMDISHLLRVKRVMNPQDPFFKMVIFIRKSLSEYFFRMPRSAGDISEIITHVLEKNAHLFQALDRAIIEHHLEAVKKEIQREISGLLQARAGIL
ncbi:MAG: hypothetical protein K0S63_1262 [Gammaproteobacteria bacterium]|nr:hypothetical protein [Gammaproteobacteria bacterium]